MKNIFFDVDSLL